MDRRDNWAKTTSPNKNVKVYIGAPASSTAAGSGYVDAATLASIVQSTKAQYSSFGGVMLWDASQAYGVSVPLRFSHASHVCLAVLTGVVVANDRFDISVKDALTGGTAAPPPSSTAAPPTTTAPHSTTTTPHSTTASPTPTTSGSCAGVAAWSSTSVVCLISKT